MAGGWLPKAGDVDWNTPVERTIQINLQSVRLVVPGGGRAFVAEDRGPLLVPRIERNTFGARSIFTREYGRSTTLGRDFGAFQVSLDLIEVPRNAPAPVPTSAEDLARMITSFATTPRPKTVVSIVDADWVFEEIPDGSFGYSYRYTRRLDDSVLVTLKFALDRERMQSDPRWLQDRRNDIDAVLRSVRIQ
jgi:hypothetical protein